LSSLHRIKSSEEGKDISNGSNNSEASPPVEDNIVAADVEFFNLRPEEGSGEEIGGIYLKDID
jgi:hypothetical protein